MVTRLQLSIHMLHDGHSVPTAAFSFHTLRPMRSELGDGNGAC